MSEIERLILSEFSLPTSYDVTLEPDLEQCTFEGSVSIEYDLLEATNEISLHAKQLNFEDAYFEVADGGNTVPIEISKSFIVQFFSNQNLIIYVFS